MSDRPDTEAIAAEPNERTPGASNWWGPYQALLAALATAEERAESAEEVIEAAGDVVTACDLSPDPIEHPDAKRSWCLSHHEWTPCPVAILREKLANYHKATGPQAESERTEK